MMRERFHDFRNRLESLSKIANPEIPAPPPRHDHDLLDLPRHGHGHRPLEASHVAQEGLRLEDHKVLHELAVHLVAATQAPAQVVGEVVCVGARQVSQGP